MTARLLLLAACATAACASDVSIVLQPDASCAGRDLTCLSYVQLAVDSRTGVSQRCGGVPAARRSFDHLGLAGAVSLSLSGGQQDAQVTGFGQSPAGPCTGPVVFSGAAALPAQGTLAVQVSCHLDCAQPPVALAGAVAGLFSIAGAEAPLVDAGELFLASSVVQGAAAEVRFAPLTTEATPDANGAFSFPSVPLLPVSTGHWCLATRVQRAGVPPTLTCNEQSPATPLVALSLDREDLATLSSQLGGAKSGFIVGQVRDAATGAALAGVTVTAVDGNAQVGYLKNGALVTDANATTDDSGLFASAVTDVVQLRASAPAHAARTQLAGASADTIGLAVISLPAQ